MIVTWEVEDGYCGKSRPQRTEIPDNELEECETEEERQAIIDEYVQNDFDNCITYCITNTK